MKPALLLAASLAAAAPAWAASPWDGTWKNDTKSINFSKKPDTYLLSGGKFRCSTCLPVIDIPADGKYHRVADQPYWDEMSVAVVDAHTIEQDTRKGGKVVGRQTIVVAPDGQSITATFNDTSAVNGVAVTGTAMQKRVGPAPAGAHAISGDWIDSAVDASDSGTTYTFGMDGDVLTYSSPNGVHYVATLGGPVAPVTGDPGWTGVKLERGGPMTIVETDYRDGKPAVVLTQTLSADGTRLSVAIENKRHNTTTSLTAIKQ